jgi:hypothetical protein
MTDRCGRTKGSFWRFANGWAGDAVAWALGVMGEVQTARALSKRTRGVALSISGHSLTNKDRSIYMEMKGRRVAYRPDKVGPATVTPRSVISPLDSE